MGGILGPREEFVLAIDPPFGPGEQPVAFTPHAGDITIRSQGAEAVVVVNNTDRAVVYGLIVAPSVYVKAAMVPWKKVLTDVGYAVQQSGLLDRLGELFTRRGK